MEWEVGSQSREREGGREKESSGVATGGMGGSEPPTSVQTPPEICSNPLKSVLYI